MLTRLFVALGFFAAIAAPSAQTDLDAFMARVLARRDDNWKKLQQYVLEERETLRLDGAVTASCTGSIASTVVHPRRRLRSQPDQGGWCRRSTKTSAGARRTAGCDASVGVKVAASHAGSIRSNHDSCRPPTSWNSSSTPANTRLRRASRSTGREALRIEYYPTKLFREGRMRPNRRTARTRRIESRRR